MRPAHLRQTVLVHLLAGLRRHEEVAPPVAVQGAEQPLGFDHFPQPRHHRPGRFLLHQLRVVDLAGGVVQDHDQVVPPLVAEPLVLAAVDVQQHARQRPPLSPSPMLSAPPVRLATRPGSLQRLLHPGVAQLDAVLRPAVSRGSAACSGRSRSPGTAAAPPRPWPAEPARARLALAPIRQARSSRPSSSRSRQRRIVRSVTPMISAASHQVIFLAIAFNSTSCSFIIRSISAAEYCSGLVNHPASPAALQSGQIMCELDRTDHILATRATKPPCVFARGGA